MEMPDATILSSRLRRVESKARPPCVGIFALIELAKFLQSVLRSSEILLQNGAMLRQAVRTPNGRTT